MSHRRKKPNVKELRLNNICPECGDKVKILPQLEVEKGRVTKIPEFFFCQCSNTKCGAKTRRFYRIKGEFWKVTRNYAIEAWNKGEYYLPPPPRS